jgi:hypothetical protein
VTPSWGFRSAWAMRGETAPRVMDSQHGNEQSAPAPAMTISKDVTRLGV